MFVANTFTSHIILTILLIGIKADVNNFSVAHRSCNFAKLVNSSFFIDKTLMISKIIDYSSLKYFTAPKGFGKSCIIDMLRCFFELEKTESGEPRTKVDYTKELVNDTKNYQIFANKLKIAEDANFMKEHFGKYPIIYLNFKYLGSLKSMSHVMQYLRNIVHKAFLEHKYLINSTKTNREGKRLCTTWIDENKFNNVSIETIGYSLFMLTILLESHYNKTCAVLVDDFSSVFTASMYYSDPIQLQKISIASWEILEPMWSKNSNLAIGIIMGLFFVQPTKVFIRVMPYIFWRANDFDTFFGITSEEFDEFAVHKNLNSTAIELASSWYDGYEYKENRFYGSRSLTFFMLNQRADNYWRRNELSVYLKFAFQYSPIRCALERLLYDAEINIRYELSMKFRDFLIFKRMIQDPNNFQCEDVAIFSSFLLAYGYLTVVNNPSIDVGRFRRIPTTVKIPNEEIKTEFRRHRAELFEEKWQLNFEAIDDCVKALNLINTNYASNETIKKDVNVFQKAFKLFLKSLPINRIIIFDKGIFLSLLLFICEKSKYNCKPQIEMRENEFIDLIVYNDVYCLVFVVRFGRRPMFGDGIRYLIDDKFYKVFQNEKIFPNGVAKFVVVEINISDTLHPRMSILVNNNDVDNIMKV